MLPQTFEQWKNCIINQCKIQLSKDFINNRLMVYTDVNNSETKKFTSLYGVTHLKNIIYWLQKAENEPTI